MKRELGFIFVFVFFVSLVSSLISFQGQTPTDGDTQNERFFEANVSVVDDAMQSFIWNWNGTNYTLFNGSTVLYYNFDNLSSLGENDSYIFDVSGNGNNISCTNCPTFNSTGGKYNGGAEFSGEGDQYLNLGNGSSLSGMSGLTISFWIYNRDISGNRNIYSKGLFDGLTDAYWGRMQGDATRFALRVGATAQNFAGQPIPADEWTFFVLRWVSGDRVKIYYNNELSSQSGGFLTGLVNSSNTEDLLIGKKDNTWADFNGTMDNFVLLDRAITDEEMNAYYMSNLRKYDADKWEFYINQTNITNASELLDYDYYSYEALMENSTGWFSAGEQNINITPVANSVAPNWTTIPDNATVVYGTSWSGVDFDAVDDTAGVTYSVNDSNFEINSTGYLTNTSALSFGTVVLQINATDENSNVNTTIYQVDVIGINLTTPKEYQIFQRHNLTTGEFVIEGEYYGSTASIEASFNGQDYVVINSSLVGNSFTGRLNSSVGNGTLVVRFSDNALANESISNVGIGDVFGVSGQSNMICQGSDGGYIEYNDSNNYLSTFYTGYGDVDTFSIADDPAVQGGRNSYYPTTISLLSQYADVPVMFIFEGEGATQIYRWDVNDLMWNRTVEAVNEGTSGTNKIAGFIWYQGESDSTSASSKYDYYIEKLENLSNNLFANFSVQNISGMNNKMAVVVIGRTLPPSGSSYTRIGTDSVRQAEVDAWGNDNNITFASHAIDIGNESVVTNVHYNGVDQKTVMGQRFGTSLLGAFYNIGDGRGPRVTAALELNDTRLRLTVNESSLPLQLRWWNGTSDVTKAEGWLLRYASGNMTDDNITATSVSGSYIYIDFESSIPDSSNLSWGSSNDAYNKTYYFDSNSIYPLPFDPVFDFNVTGGNFNISRDVVYINSTIIVHGNGRFQYLDDGVASDVIFRFIPSDGFPDADDSNQLIRLNITGFSTDNVSWVASNLSTSLTSVNFTICNLTESGNYTFYVDSSASVNYTANSSGCVAAQYSGGWSEHEFGLESYTVSSVASVTDEDSDSSSSGGSSGTITYSLSDSDLDDGYTQSMGRNWQMRFNIGEESHELKVGEIGSDFVTVTVSSDPMTFNLSVNETKKVDLDGNGFYDLEVFLKSLTTYRAELFVHKINESVPEEDKPVVDEENQEEASYGNEEGVSLGNGYWVYGIIAAVLIIAAVIFFIKFRQKSSKRK